MQGNTEENIRTFIKMFLCTTRLKRKLSNYLAEGRKRKLIKSKQSARELLPWCPGET